MENIIEKIKLFFINILTKILGFSIKIKGNTINITCKTNRGEKNLRKVLLKVVEKMNKEK